ncbi:DUF397 domain-containing protein [Streptomyces harbinensis]|uniref:DUF397 domain-containing protein n=1 Tax=Streptomyces harbinensis TaxID=1176198 RepID=A0A1I6U075_9ACTN|nr:DUF397 domain-containing protein [Streptomyces harbinensis]SFS94687.1 protein of unknown function [Streptomyces harbinensis]
MRHDLPIARWRKSSYSDGGSGSCLETQVTADGGVAVGDSKDRSRGAFVFSVAGWSAFVNHLKG